MQNIRQNDGKIFFFECRYCSAQVMWRGAIDKIEVMDSPDRERIWPELVRGFKDLSKRLKV